MRVVASKRWYGYYIVPMARKHPDKLTHVDAAGAARMVDVGAKRATVRTATAGGRIRMKPETLAAIRDGAVKKGDVLAVARIAGIQAAKETSRLIPLCHPLPIEAVSVDFTLQDDAIEVCARVRLTGKTGVEMEALTAASVALLTIYDMAKALDRGMVIEEVRLLEKTGGRSGAFRA